MINYHSKKPTFLRLKCHSNLLSYCCNLPSFQGKFNVINIPMVIYCHSTVISKVMLLYNKEWWYDHGMAVNYHGKKFYNIGSRCQFPLKWHHLRPQRLHLSQNLRPYAKKVLWHWPQVAAWCICCENNSKIADNSTTAKAREKNKRRFRILGIVEKSL